MENNFENKIKEVINHPPEFPVDGEAWASISQRLKTPSTPIRERSYQWFWIPLALNNIFKNHNNLIVNQKTTSTNTSLSDLIFNNNNSSNYFYNQKNPFQFINTPTSERSSYFSNASIQNRWKDYQERLSNKSSEKLIANFGTTKLNSATFGYVNSNSNPHLEDLDDLDFSDIKFENKKWKYRLQTMKPDRFALGFRTGIGYNFGFDFPNSEQNNYANGLEAEIGFGNQLSWVIGLDYQVQDLKLNHDDNIGFDLSLYPEILPQDPTDELEQIKNEFISINIPIGFKYSFLPSQKIQPYLGFGFLTRKIIASKGKFKFEQTIGNGEYEIIEDNFLLTEFDWQNLWGNLGAQVSVYNQWRFFVEGRYQFNLSQEDFSRFEQNQLFSGNAGLKYHF